MSFDQRKQEMLERHKLLEIEARRRALIRGIMYGLILTAGCGLMGFIVWVVVKVMQFNGVI